MGIDVILFFFKKYLESLDNTLSSMDTIVLKFTTKKLKIVQNLIPLEFDTLKKNPLLVIQNSQVGFKRRDGLYWMRIGPRIMKGGS